MTTASRAREARGSGPAPAHQAGRGTNMAEAIAARCRRLPAAPVVGGQERLRWHVLDGRGFLQRMEALAGDLTARGIGPGDRVVVWVPNGWRTPVLFAAIWHAGAIVVPFDREMNVEAARSILRMVEPRLIITGYSQRPAWAPDAGLEEWWEPRTAAQAMDAAQGGEEATGSGGTANLQASGDDVAAIYFTSGTTGAPKGCTITHRNLLSQVEALRTIIPVGLGDTLASILPLSHLFELTCGMNFPLVQGAYVAYVPSRKGPDIVRVLHEQRATHLIVVPQVLTLMGTAAEERLTALLGARRYRRLQHLADRLPMSMRRLLFWPLLHRLGGRLRFIASGGAALNPEVQQLWERLGIRTVQGFGASECSPIIACARPDGSTPYGSVGLPLPGVEVRIDAQGQLLARGPNVMRGYWRDPERTAAVIDGEGFYATGDLVERDGRGNIRILGRAQELLALPSGMKVWPEDVEDQFRRVEGVKDAVAILVPRQGGATLHAYLIPEGAADAERLPAIVAAANGHLAAHQRVAGASWWPDEDFPRTSTLKVKRRLIPPPDQATAATQGNGVGTVKADPTRAGGDLVLEAVRAISGKAGAADGDTLAALGLDSLGITGLAVEIEARTGLTIPEDAIDPAMTVAAVRASLAALGAEQPIHDAPAGERAADREHAKRMDEGRTWLPPVWLYTRGRFLRRLSAPIAVLHRFAVPRLICVGGEHLAALQDGVILAGTHRSYPDVPTIRRAIAEHAGAGAADRLAIAASSAIVGRAGLLGRFATTAFGLFPLRQYGGQEESLRRLAQIADRGSSILIFPQGHHTDPAAEQAGDPAADFKPGVGRLAIDLERPVLPFGLAGSERIVPYRVPETFNGLVLAGIPVAIKRQPVAIAFGAPMRPEAGENPAAFARRLQAVCFALSRRAEATLDAARQ